MGARVVGGLLLFLLLVAGAALFGVRFQPGSWYAGLVKPAWTPPNALFGPVWSVLYLGIAVAGWLVWRRSGWRGPALAFWTFQLVLNALWSWLFFGLHRPLWALCDIALLWAAALAFAILSWGVSRPAAVLFIPYLIWVAYAAALNAALWRLNRG
ncbi:MAG: TspO/MBR family protein [Acidobacteriota bacterium]